MNPRENKDQQFHLHIGPRRRPNSATPRTHTRYIRLTIDEDKELHRRADTLNITVARLLHEGCMRDTSGFTADQLRAIGELHMLIVSLRNLANFTNGIARIANTEKRLPEEAAEIYPAYMRLSRHIHSVLDRING